MSTKVRVGSIFVGALIAAMALVLLLPPPDPLAKARTVFVAGTGLAQETAGGQIEKGLDIVLNQRNLILVSDPDQADVVLEVESVSLNLGDVEISLQDGRFGGQVSAECVVTDAASARTYTMDLLVQVRHDRWVASLKARRFWEFWK